MSKIIEGLLGTVYKMSKEEIAEALKKSDGTEGIDEEKALQLIIDKDKERIAKIKADGPKWDDAIKKATKEVWSNVEKSLKKTFDVESDLQGDELIAFVSETVKEKLKAEPGKGKKVEDITEDDIKKHPVFIAAEKSYKKALAEKEAEKTNALKEMEAGFTQKENFSKVKDAALLKFKKLQNIILPADAEKANKMIQRLLIDELSPYEYQVDANGKFLLLHKEGDKKGKRVEDAHGNALEFDDMIELIAKSNFEFKVADDRNAPANGGDNGKNGGTGGKEKKYTGKAPADKQAYLGLLTDDALTSDQKLEIKQEYGEQFSKN